jgi:hypothetical protein
MDSLYLCVNGNSDNFGIATGLCSEDDCPDCVTEMEGEEEKYNFVDGLPRDDEYFEERMIPGNPDFCNG